MMARYWVVGGEYTDTSFTALVPGAVEERHGPFETYKEAYQIWEGRARQTIDHATIRFRIMQEPQTPQTP